MLPKRNFNVTALAENALNQQENELLGIWGCQIMCITLIAIRIHAKLKIRDVADFLIFLCLMAITC